MQSLIQVTGAENILSVIVCDKYFTRLSGFQACKMLDSFSPDTPPTLHDFELLFDKFPYFPPGNSHYHLDMAIFKPMGTQNNPLCKLTFPSFRMRMIALHLLSLTELGL